MKTEKCYQKNVYQKEAELVLLEVIPMEGGIKAAFESTIFFPEGGGQLCDIGWIGGHPVTDVHEKDGIVWHTIQGDGNWVIGENYHAELDWNRRFLHMQMHCGEHILSGIFHKMYGAENKGFHMGSDYVTIDIDWPEGEMTSEMIAAVERAANEAVWRNEPVVTRWFANSGEAMCMPVRKAIKFDQDISVVLIGNEADPTDCCACCGTHPAFSGEVGLIKIVHVEKYKGMQRFYVKTGAKAYEDYCHRQKLTDALGQKYSCEMNDILKALDAEEKRQFELFRKYAALKDHAFGLALDEVGSLLALPVADGIREVHYDYLEADDLQLIARKLETQIDGLLILSNDKAGICILASSGALDCGKIMKEYAPKFEGKGGGKQKLARGIFSSTDSMNRFIHQLRATFGKENASSGTPCFEWSAIHLGASLAGGENDPQSGWKKKDV